MRIFSFALLALSLMLPAPLARSHFQSTLTEEELQGYYFGYNEDFFMGQLPNTTVVQWGDLSTIHAMAVTTGGEDKDSPFTIIIDQDTNSVDREVLMTLFHEMCHVKVHWGELDQHGEKWQACMVNLADQGAFQDLW